MASWNQNHPPCTGGCGMLADECACPRPRPLGAMEVAEPDDVNYVEGCRAALCRKDAEPGSRYCIKHEGQD